MHVIVTPDVKHKKVFPEVLLTDLKNNKSLRDHSVTSKLPDNKQTGMSKSCAGKRPPCHLCKSTKDTCTFKVNTLMSYIKLTMIIIVIQKWLFI